MTWTIYSGKFISRKQLTVKVTLNKTTRESHVMNELFSKFFSMVKNQELKPRIFFFLHWMSKQPWNGHRTRIVNINIKYMKYMLNWNLKSIGIGE